MVKIVVDEELTLTMACGKCEDIKSAMKWFVDLVNSPCVNPPWILTVDPDGHPELVNLKNVKTIKVVE